MDKDRDGSLGLTVLALLPSCVDLPSFPMSDDGADSAAGMVAEGAAEVGADAVARGTTGARADGRADAGADGCRGRSAPGWAPDMP